MFNVTQNIKDTDIDAIAMNYIKTLLKCNLTSS